MKKLLLLSVSCLFYSLLCEAQKTFPLNGVSDERPHVYAFTHATIVVDPLTRIEDATLLIKGQWIQDVGTQVNIPEEAVIIDLKGKYIYPGLIDPFSTYGIAELKKGSAKDGPQFISSKKGAYNWNEAVKPETEAKDFFMVDPKKADELRRFGFSSLMTFQRDGIFRGTSCVVTLDDGRENEVLLKERSCSNYSFNKGISQQDYPSSLMGSIALIRQTLYDAEWYKNNQNSSDKNISLQSLNDQASLPRLFEIDEIQDISRVKKIGDEFAVKFMMKGTGTEYQRISEAQKANTSFIIPINFPKAYDVEDPADAGQVSLAQMKHWEMAPSNPASMEKNHISFALTAAGLDNLRDFWQNIRLAIQHGLSEEQALRSLTQTPAEMIGVSDKEGSLQKGKLANFLLVSGDLFDKNTIIYDNWIRGKRYVVNNAQQPDIRGTYSLNIDELPPLTLEISGSANSPDWNVSLNDSVKTHVNITRRENLLSFNFSFSDKRKALKNLKGDTIKGSVRCSGYINTINPLMFKGNGNLPDGTEISWSALFKSALKEKDKKKDSLSAEMENDKVIYPFLAYGWTEEPTAKKVLIKNTTVWTNEQAGKMENTDVLVNNGKIEKVGKDLSVPDAMMIDGNGKHLTPGIIDEHSHIAISRGVNEGTQAVTSEVSIADVVDDADINIYRQLSGGVTTSHLLHGSANPVGGQTALIKLRWGKSPEEMKFENADGFIKFALGENVKQSNWGDRNVIRFPQTRMGVEQVYYDAFIRAKEYEKNRKNEKVKTRKDLELDALVEILNAKRFITCHSYVQSEINMLMHVADSMGFKVNTFTHILEGYKVADKMKAHGVYASTFADWWAYKYEVIDAIPYNAAIMTSVGVNTCINSDDAEMARRLNQEAAKTIKYGGVKEEDALKMVTLNPAKALHIEQRVGSIKEGKDADLVLWSDNPLSIYAHAEKTFVDGIMYFDRDQDKKMREEIKKERARLIQKMMDAKIHGERTQKPAQKSKKQYHCDDIEDEGNYVSQ